MGTQGPTRFIGPQRLCGFALRGESLLADAEAENVDAR